jgi:hypothetical protein
LVIGGGLVASACTAISGASDLKVGQDDGFATEGGAIEAAGGTIPGADGGSNSGGDSGIGPSETCDAPATCKRTPDGWSGPFAVLLADATRKAECGSDFVRSWERIDSTADGSMAPPAQCTCSCSMANGSCVVTLNAYQDDGCQGNAAKRVLTADSCAELPFGTDSYKATTQIRVECAPAASAIVVPIEGAKTLALGCSPRTPGGCASSEVCMPPLPSGARLCVRPPKEVLSPPPCPPEYPSVVSLQPAVEDTRGCTPCTCTPAVSCAFRYTIHNEDDCTDRAVTRSDLECTSPGNADAVKLLSSSVEGTCNASGGHPVGEVTTAPAATLCCAL